MSHAMIDNSLPATRRDRRLYRNGSQRLSFTCPNEIAAAIKQLDLEKSPMTSPRADLNAASIYTKRDRLSVRSWRGFEGLAVTHGWRVEANPPAPKEYALPNDVQAGG
mmetsp:Transcript_23845/g.61423  ORF Transcript_23845/g.61423 Transcript_23845/m.61423 type:complete len:108 (+) Transcript_23845:126-449(+)